MDGTGGAEGWRCCWTLSREVSEMLLKEQKVLREAAGDASASGLGAGSAESSRYCKCSYRCSVEVQKENRFLLTTLKV